MKPSEVYRRAAELIASGVRFNVLEAIDYISREPRFHSEAINFYLYKMEGNFGDFTPENQRARELALYLMAEIAKELE